MNHYDRRDIALLVCLLLMVIVGVVAYFRPVVAATALPEESAYAEWSYPIPIEPDTQSGAPFLDRNGRVFSVVRDNAHLQVYRDGTLVLAKHEAYGAVFGQIRNDGMQQEELVIESYRFPEDVNTQSGTVIKDATGQAFLIGRSVRNASLCVYRNDQCLVCGISELYGAPSASVDPLDGRLWVSVRENNTRGIRRVRVPFFQPFALSQMRLPLIENR